MPNLTHASVQSLQAKVMNLPTNLRRDDSAGLASQHGEGVGLQLVKWLSEAIGASVEIESIHKWVYWYVFAC